MDLHRLIAYAQQHHGIFDNGVLEALEISKKVAQHRVQRGEWLRLHRGVYCFASAPPGFSGQAEAVLRSVPKAVLSHESARWIHRIGTEQRTTEPVRPTITVPPPHGPQRAGVTIHRRQLRPDETTKRRGWPVTTVERTLVDSAAESSPIALVSLVESALLAQQTTRLRLAQAVENNTRPGPGGVAKLRSVLAALDGEITESELERRYVRRASQLGLPPMERQARFEWLGAERCRVDFWYPQAAVIVEVDGRSFHARSAAFDRDRQRDLAAAAQDIRVIRITDQMLDDPTTHGLLRTILVP